MSKIIKLDEQFVEKALDVYEELLPDEMLDLKYKILIKKIMQKLRGEEFLKSHIKRGYEQFKAYYLSHFLTKLNKYAKGEDEEIFLDDVEPLLKYDIFKEKIQKILADKDTIYRYYWYDQEVTNQHSQTEKRRILIFESDIETIEIIYELITKWYDLCESVYCGFGGIVMIFQNIEEKYYFDSFLNCIRKK